jgi:hypothetical protein
MRRLSLLVLVGAPAVILLAAPAAATAPRPDAHDRALAARLDTEVAAFRAIAAQTSGDASTRSLDGCLYLKKHPKDAFAAIFVLLPALVIELVAEHKQELTGLERAVAGMRPDSALFRRWLAAERASLRLILEFDNGGRKIDLCKAAAVMLDKTSTPADIRRVLGVDPGLIPKLFSGNSSAAGSTVTTLNPKMRAFLIAAGVPRKHAVVLTS